MSIRGTRPVLGSHLRAESSTRFASYYIPRAEMGRQATGMRHPLEWNAGEAAGMLAAYCLNNRATPHQVQADDTQLASFQALLAKQGLEISWPEIRAY